MTAVERVLCAVKIARANVGDLFDDDDLRATLDGIANAAKICPRCGFVGDGDCACPAVRR